MFFLIVPILILIALFTSGTGRSGGGDYNGGNWECIRKNNEYGNRCVERDYGKYDFKDECETFCLKQDELPHNIEGIIKMTFDRGIILPTPRSFLENLIHNTDDMDELDEFNSLGKADIMFILQDDTFYAIPTILKQYGITPRLYEYFITDVNSDYYKKSILPKIENGIRNGNEKAKELLKEISSTGLSINTEEILDNRYTADEALLGDDIVIIGISLMYKTCEHANSIIINHATKTIHHYEPEFGRISPGWEKLYEHMKKFLEPLVNNGYKFETSIACPISMQSIDKRPYCALWSIMFSLLSILNPGKSLRKITNYLIGTGEDVSLYFDIFLFYLYSTISDKLKDFDLEWIFYGDYSPKELIKQLHKQRRDIIELKKGGIKGKLINAILKSARITTHKIFSIARKKNQTHDDIIDLYVAKEMVGINDEYIEYIHSSDFDPTADDRMAMNYHEEIYDSTRRHEHETAVDELGSECTIL